MQHDGITRPDHAARAPAGGDPVGVPRPRAETPAEPAGPAPGEPNEEETLTGLADLTAPGTLGDYAELLAALTAYDITGVRPAELERYLADGHVPQGMGEDTLRLARGIAERERERLLRLTRP